MNREKFVSYATGGPDTVSLRTALADHFRLCDNFVVSYHAEADAYYMADYILRHRDLPGDCAEFGCAAGAMTCKLSRVCEAIGKRYHVYDTFCGLPADGDYKSFMPSMDSASAFLTGAFAYDYQTVATTVKRHGSIGVCQFHEGLVEDTVHDSSGPFVFAFIDLDLIEPARHVIRCVWPKLTGSGLFTHEASVLDYMRSILDPAWWREKMKADPPWCGHHVQNKAFGMENTHCLDFLHKEKR